MTTPERYLQIISEMGLEHLEIQVSSISEAKQLLSQMRDYQRQLRFLKRDINSEMRAIRAEYTAKMASAASTTSGIVSLFGKRKLAGQIRAAEKRRLRSERDQILAPYENVKRVIDDLQIQIERAKVQLKAFIEQMRSSEKAVEAVCPQCHRPIAKEDKFCRHCGFRLN